LPLPRVVLAVVACLIRLPNEVSGLGAAFSCFGFRFSRLLRICPLAMTERPFHESFTLSGLQCASRPETVLRHHPLMTLAIVANAILWRIFPWRKRSDDPIGLRAFRKRAEGSAKAYQLSHRKKMGCSLAAVRIALLDGCYGHDGSRSFSSAASRSAGRTGTICCLELFKAIDGRWIKAATRRQASRKFPLAIPRPLPPVAARRSPAT